MEGSLSTLAWGRGRILRNTVHSIRHQSWLKIIVLALFAIGFWAGLYLLFMDGFRFLSGAFLVDLRPIIIQILFAAFFLSLLILLSFSNAIIAYGSLFRSDETAFLFAKPFRPWQLFTYKLTETLLFSSWAFLFLALPLIVAYGVSIGAPWYYYPGAALFFTVFALIPAAFGGIATLLVARFFPRSTRRALVILLVIVVMPFILWGIGFFRAYLLPGSDQMPWAQKILGRLAMTRLPLLPSYWAEEGILRLAEGDMPAAIFRFLLLLSTGLFAGMAGIHLSRWFYSEAYHRVQSYSRRGRSLFSDRPYRMLDHLLAWMSPDLRALVIKDVKTFLRDPVQWSQVLIFFGLLAVYFANIRNLQFDLSAPFWRNFISILNLIATALTLSTFTSRFIFPLLSLEGRKFWILALLPLDRKNLIYSKFWFAFTGSFVLSEGLTALSDLALQLPWSVAALHAVIMLIICGGLSSLAVGIGALYPNLRESNPSKIVSGFGGTLNLVLSTLLVAMVIALTAVPYHFSRMGNFEAGFLARLVIPGGVIAVIAGIVAVLLPLWLGVKAFERLEV